MIAVSHYDNGVADWGMSPKEKALNVQRLRRLGSIPQFICGEYQLPDHYEDSQLLKLIAEKKFASLDAACKELRWRRC